MASTFRNKENKPLSTRADASILSLSRTPGSEDFFTDSLLDASKIPTPSPKKQAFSAAYKGRRALGNTRTLKDAWNATADPGQAQSAERNKFRTSASLKPLPSQAQSRGPVSRDGRKTTPSPSPHRPSPGLPGNTADISSPPPRGLTDVYQRIAEEEDLAGQEGEFDEDESDEMLPEDISVNGDDQSRPFSAHSSPFPPTNHERLAQLYDAGADKENVERDDATTMSDPSGMSFLQGLTDQSLAAKLTPHAVDHAKDRARIEKAVRNDRPIAFRHGDRNRDGLTKDNLIQNGSSADPHGRPESSAGSFTTDRSDPLPNIARQWGTKSKAGRDWLNSRKDGVRSSPIPESSQLDWQSAAAQMALPSVEDSSTPVPQSTDERASYLQRQSSLDRIRQWDLHDFTGQSFQASESPPVRLRSTAKYEVRDKEIERLHAQAVTTSRLGELRQRDSGEQLRLSRTNSSGAAPLNDMEVALPGQKIAETQGESIPDTPVVIYRSSSTSSKSDNAAASLDATPGRGSILVHKSHEQLRRLARATSNSPRSSPSSDNQSSNKLENVVNEVETEDRSHIERLSGGEASRKSSKEVADLIDTPQRVLDSTSAKTPVVIGAWTNTILPDTIKTTRKQNQTTGTRYAQTPHVTAGGWVDTPVTARRNISSLAPIPLEQVPEELVEGIVQSSAKETSNEVRGLTADGPAQSPQKSALASLLSRAKRRLISQDITEGHESQQQPEAGASNDTLNLGEATLESLEDLLTLDANDMTTLIRLGAEAEAADLLNAPHDINGEDGRFSANDPAAEAAMLDRLSTKLDRLRSNIHDARKGISKLEHQVSRAPSAPESQALVLPPSGTLNTTGGAGGACTNCGCPRPLLRPTSQSTWLNPMMYYLLIPIPALFHPRQKPQWLPRPTRLGGLIFAIWIWYLAECVMAELYEHPLYAAHYDWPVQREPQFPFVMPTMACRWMGIEDLWFAGGGLAAGIWRTGYTVVVAVFRIVMRACGVSDGFVDSAWGGGGSAVEMARQPLASRVPGGSGGIGLSMMHDELI